MDLEHGYPSRGIKGHPSILDMLELHKRIVSGYTVRCAAELTEESSARSRGSQLPVRSYRLGHPKPLPQHTLSRFSNVRGCGDVPE